MLTVLICFVVAILFVTCVVIAYHIGYHSAEESHIQRMRKPLGHRPFRGVCSEEEIAEIKRRVMR